MKNRRFCFWVLSIFLLSLLVTSAQAKPKLKISLHGTSQYSDNLYLGEEEIRESGIVTRITPGLSFFLPPARTYFQVDYQPEYVHIVNEETKNFWTQRGKALLRHNFSEMTSLGVSHSLQISELPEMPEKTYTLNTTSGSLKKQLGSRFVANIGYAYEIFDEPSEPPTFSNYEDTQYSLGIEWRRSPTFSWNIGYNSGGREFTEKADGQDNPKSYRVAGSSSLNFTKEFSPKSRANLGVGYVKRNYEWLEVEEIEEDKEIKKDVEHWTYDFGFSRRLGKFSTLNLSYGYGIQDTFYSRPVELESPFRRAEETLSDIDRLYRYMTVSRYGALLTFVPSERNSYTLGYSYQRNEVEKEASLHSGYGSPPTVEKDLDEGVSMTGIQYTHRFTRWLALNLGYSYGNRDSNIRGDYDFSNYSFSLALSF